MSWPGIASVEWAAGAGGCCHRVCRAHLCARAWKARIYGFYELRDFYHTENSGSIESYNYIYTIKLLL